MSFHHDLLKAAANLQQVIDVHSAMCIAHKDNTSPEVVKAREKLEKSLAEGRETLRLIQRRLV